MSRTFGAPFGAVVSCGKSFAESLIVRPTCPLKGGSGLGRTSCAATSGCATAAHSRRPRAVRRVLVFFMVSFEGAETARGAFGPRAGLILRLLARVGRTCP